MASHQHKDGPKKGENSPGSDDSLSIASGSGVLWAIAAEKLRLAEHKLNQSLEQSPSVKQSREGLVNLAASHLSEMDFRARVRALIKVEEEAELEPSAGLKEALEKSRDFVLGIQVKEPGVNRLVKGHLVKKAADELWCALDSAPYSIQRNLQHDNINVTIYDGMSRESSLGGIKTVSRKMIAPESVKQTLSSALVGDVQLLSYRGPGGESIFEVQMPKRPNLSPFLASQEENVWQRVRSEVREQLNKVCADMHSSVHSNMEVDILPDKPDQNFAAKFIMKPTIGVFTEHCSEDELKDLKGAIDERLKQSTSWPRSLASKLSLLAAGRVSDFKNSIRQAFANAGRAVFGEILIKKDGEKKD